MKPSTRIVIFAIALVAAKLALLPFQRTLPTALLSTLSDCGLTLLLVWSAWQASRRSAPFARAVWMGIGLAFVFQTLSFGVVASVLVSGTLQEALKAFWPATIVSYLIAVALAVPLLLSEDHERPGIDWLQTLDIAQLGILTLSAYLVFFYIPVNTGLSDVQRNHYFMILHWARDGFLGLGYLYRGWRSRSQDFRRLQFRLSAFFAAYGVTGSLFFQATQVWRWPQPVVAFIADLPALFLLVTAATWRQQAAEEPPMEKPESRNRTFWTQWLTVLMPFSVVALASRISSQYLRMAWIAVTSSFVCYAARLFIMQHNLQATVLKLSATEEKFSRAFQSSPVAIAISRLADGRYVDANDRWLDLLKLTREQVIGHTAVELGIFQTEEDRHRLVEAIQRQGSLRSLPFSFRMAGRTIETLVSAEIIEFDGNPAVVSSILDVTELRNVTQQLHQAQKMELVGSLAGGIAHDFNNLITIIKGHSDLAQERGLEGEWAEDIRQIRGAADRAATLTRQLLAFSRRQVLQPRNIALDAVVAGIEKMLRPTIGKSIELVTSFAPDLGIVHADPAQIEQVVMNLAINARDAMPNGGRLLFETKNLDLSSPYPGKGFEIPAGRHVMLIVTDTGTGIAPEHLDRLFEPFFTTKEAGRGTGLGLSTVYGIVKQSGGYVWVYSETGLGTTFNVCLPRVEQPADALTPMETSPRSLAGTETILVAEDDQRVCELTATILAQHGYHVITANSGDEALRRAGEFNGTIHLLLTDVIMAKTGGGELARRLKDQRPGLKVLFMSGYPHFPQSGESAIDFREAILAKPFTSIELACAIRSALEQKVQAGDT